MALENIQYITLRIETRWRECICKRKKEKGFFVDGMTDHYSNFIKRMEKEQVPFRI